MRGDAAELVRAAIEAGHSTDRTKFFDNSDEAAKFLADSFARGDLLLLKGSRGVKMEKILRRSKRGTTQSRTGRGTKQSKRGRKGTR